MPTVAIVNYDMGNLFSVKQACEHVGLRAVMTSSKHDIRAADAIILPGVGAFGKAMATLQRYDLIEVLQETAMSSKPFLGICLGMQLLMEESFEFGHHQGLGIIQGKVVRFESPAASSGHQVKVPQVGWNRIYQAAQNSTQNMPRNHKYWENSLLHGISNNDFMYFIHSFYVVPEDSDCILSVSQYWHIEFCSSLQFQNTFACQFHPERSGPKGLIIYENLAARIANA